LSDLVSISARLRTRHVNGVNTLRADGSGRWVPSGAFIVPLNEITSVRPNATWNAEQDRIYEALERN